VPLFGSEESGRWRRQRHERATPAAAQLRPDPQPRCHCFNVADAARAPKGANPSAGGGAGIPVLHRKAARRNLGNQRGDRVVRPGMRNRLIRAATVLTAATIALLVTASPAAACGGLVGENGTIQLTRTTTLAAYHDGIEHYVTSFEFTGEGTQVGSIVPLPGIPTNVQRGGDWTLQRLQLEVNPPVELQAADRATAAASGGVEVILQTKIDALDITVLKGGGTEVGQWATDNGFLLTPDAPEVLDYYSQRSPVFMAARFDAAAAQARGQQSGDGTPIHLTIPVDRPWVPLRILALGRDADSVVQADVFMLTDRRPQLLAGDEGLKLTRSEAASSSLLDDLRSDKGMEWIPDTAWLTYITIDTPAGQLTHDLAASVNPRVPPLETDAGFTSGNDFIETLTHPDRYGWVAPTAILSAIVIAVVSFQLMSTRRRPLAR